MLGQPEVAAQQLTWFYQQHVLARKRTISRTIHEVCKIVQDVLKEVENQEPRFISTLTENNGRYEGLIVNSPSEFEVILYLNQMGVFNFVDDGSIPGCAVLKLSDGRKRSMSLWVEFITASGYLSSRKIRSRFQTLVAQAVDKCQHRDYVKMIPDTTEVKLRIRERIVVQISCSFRCASIWPRSASAWPTAQVPWPVPQLIAEVKTEGFDLLSREIGPIMNKQQSTAEGDAWFMCFIQAENILLHHGSRKKCLSVLKALKDVHLDKEHQNPITAYILKTLVLYECEKHPHEASWTELSLGDRVVGILLQLVSCLQNRRCPHYFIPAMDLFKGKPTDMLDRAAKNAWVLVRDLIMNPRALELTPVGYIGL